MAQSNQELSTRVAQNTGVPAVPAFENLLKQMFVQNQKKLLNLCGDEKKAAKLMTTVIMVADKNPQVMQCTPQSILSCILQSAAENLWPVGHPPKAYYVPYKGTLTFIPSYQAYIAKMFETGYVTKINCKVVWEADEFEYIEGSDEKIIHRSYRGHDSGRGARIGVYCITRNKYGFEEITFLTASQVEGIRSRSAAKDSQYSPWNSKTPLEVDWMWMKSAIRQRYKMIPDIQEIPDDDDVRAVEVAAPNKAGIGLDATRILGDTTVSQQPAPQEEVVDKATGEVKAESVKGNY